VWLSKTSAHHRSQSANAAARPSSPPPAYQASISPVDHRDHVPEPDGEEPDPGEVDRVQVAVHAREPVGEHPPDQTPAEQQHPEEQAGQLDEDLFHRP
jgi:hypothetical protein